MIEFILLGFLMYREMTGYDLKQAMGQSTSNFYDASYGSIYPALKRLEAAGYVQLREEASGNRAKKIYAIRDSGRQRFLQWLASPLGISKNSTEPLIRVFFLQLLEPAKAQTLIRGYQDRLQEAITHLEGIEPQVAVIANPFQQATLLYGKEHYQHQLRWCDQIISMLQPSAERNQ